MHKKDKNENEQSSKLWTMEDTSELMLSSNYANRLKAEYRQLVIRIYNLEKYIPKTEEEKDNYKCAVPLYLLNRQLAVMKEYKEILEARARLDWVDLDD